MTKHNPHEEINFDEISHMTNKEQANVILDSILAINNSYDTIKKEDIDIPIIQ